MREYKPTAASFLISENCNMACKYCFEILSSGHKKESMTQDTVSSGLELLFKNAIETNTNEVTATMFGGEPMLKPDLVVFAIEKGRELNKIYGINYSLNIVTNGTLIPQKTVDILTELFKDRNDFSVQLSLDGIGEVNDEMRVFKNGKGSFDTIMKNVPKFKQIFGGDEYDSPKYNRYFNSHASLTKRTAPHLFETYKHLVEERNMRWTWFMPIQSEDWNEEDLEIYREQLRLIVEYMKDKIRNREKYFEYVIKEYATFERFLGVYRTEQINGRGMYSKPCGAGVNYGTFTANGDVYPCHQFYYYENSEYLNLGNIKEPDKIKHERTKLFQDYDKRDLFCSIDKDCPLIDYCYNCIADSYSANGSILSPNITARCKMTKIEKEATLEVAEFYRNETGEEVKVNE